MKFTPVYERDEKRFLIALKGFLGDTKEDASKIALGSMLVECIVFGMKVDPNNIKEIPEDNDEGVLKVSEATLGDLPVYILDETVCHCGKELTHQGDCGVYPSDFFICEKCNDAAYDEKGERLWRME